MRREGVEPRGPAGVGPIDYIAIDVTRIDISASMVRERLDAGRSIRFMVPESIREDIERAWASTRPGSRPEPAVSEA
jgi:nicotinic acid mononucleotide adenylyltransferase